MFLRQVEGVSAPQQLPVAAQQAFQERLALGEGFCFQEARKVLAADREEKLKLIATERLRISNLVATDASNIRGGEATKQKREQQHIF